MFSRRLVDVEVAKWQFDGFALLIDNFSSGSNLPDAPLFLPTPDFSRILIGRHGHMREKFSSM